MTPLEALEILKKRHWVDIEHYTALCEYIETALKRLEQLEVDKQSFDRLLEKKLKALEIVKKCCLLSKHELAFTNKIEINQEEYNLLKEVL